MTTFLLVGIAVTAGIFVLMTLAVFSNRPRHEEIHAPSVDRIAGFVESLGFEIATVRGQPPEIVEMEAIDPSPPIGDTVLVRCLPKSDHPPGPAEVDAFVDAVQQAGVNRGFLFTPDLVTEAAMHRANGTPVEVFDPPAVAAMTR